MDSKPINIEIVTPARRGSRAGNRITALRWALFLRRLGRHVTITDIHRQRDADLVIAVNARKSHASIVAAKSESPERPLFVLLSGTDLYVDSPQDPSVSRSLEMADRILTLHSLAATSLSPELKPKVRVILQSASPAPPIARDVNRFEGLVIGHLRDVKDPLLAARAARRLPPESSFLVTQIGDALSPEWGERVRSEETTNRRYRWLGLLHRREVLGRLAAADLLILTSRSEGGANVLSEALVADIPIIATRIDATVALLGEDYPGLFPVGDVTALSERMLRGEQDPAFLESLRRWGRARRGPFDPALESSAWHHLLSEFPSLTESP